MKARACLSFVLLIIPYVVWPLVFTAKDHPYDDGNAIDLFWSNESSNKSNSATPNRSYTKFRLEKKDSLGLWTPIATFSNGETRFTDSENNNIQFISTYRLTASNIDSTQVEMLIAMAYPHKQWFNLKKLPLLVMLLAVSLAVIVFIIAARKGKGLFIRRINGLESMDEAVGRATEKGKPILFVPGIGDLDDIQTIASLTILSQLAYKAASYNAEIVVPVCRSMVLSTAREVVKESYLRAGKPDEYKPDSVFYLTDDQFGYVAGIDGIMLREQPAANFFLGTFYAEALILAETGFGTGAMQTAGTAQPHQLPFFVVSCDYTLIGEELFAASAYLSKAPDQIGSLKGQDLGKIIIVTLILVGTMLEIFGIHWLKNFLMME